MHEDIPKCMPEEFLLLEPVKLDIRGFESRRALQNVSPVDWFVLRDAKDDAHDIVCERTFLFRIRYHSAKREVLRYASQSNAKASLA